MLAFARLPFSFLVSSLVLACTALPVQSSEHDLLVLTPENFESTVAEGVWFIEHFSPYCHHCRDFMPLWTQIAREFEAKPDPGIRLAQVNCAVNGDLCAQHKVDGYPQMNLYRNGEFVETFRKSRNHDILTNYLTSHAEPRNPHAAETAQPSSTTVEAAEPENDELVQEFASHKDANPGGIVLSLDESNYQNTIDEGHVFVKFFAPWCGHCKKLAPIWNQLGAAMQHRLTIAEVNCEAHSAICKKASVTGYPMLIYFGGKGSGNTEYTGGRKFDQLKAFSDKVSGPGAQELKFADLEKTVADSPVFYLFLHTSAQKTIFSQVMDASNVLFGSPAFYTSTSSAFYDHFNIPKGTAAILALKDHDSAVPAAVHTIPALITTTSERQELVDWLVRNRLPTALELEQDNFQDIMNAQHKPLVVIAPAAKDSKAATAKAVTDLARQWRDAKETAPVVFAWMDADRWGAWLKSMYGLRAGAGAGAPAVVVANHARLVYWDTDPFGEKLQLSQSSLFPTINSAAHGTLAYKHSENVVERLARFLNGKLISLETYVSTNPWHTAFFAVAVLVALGLGVRRLLADDDAREGGYYRKGDRLD
ncbi:thioredoxin-domain-containing protein [Epithele typhae]|uniref:thioredoxin-domain-containing protein n=1 Tax=Epithele typhae TaxID=378194 RepID=UPI002007499E|nr:thioredoxin-domain-containing protein [Epithele typhae]KAH9936885.1 thioredoxin-domain-containing protein [Epithele typhae]